MNCNECKEVINDDATRCNHCRSWQSVTGMFSKKIEVAIIGFILAVSVFVGLYYFSINQLHEVRFTSYSQDVVSIVKPMLGNELEIIDSKHSLVFRGLSLGMTVKPSEGNRYNAILHFDQPVNDKFCVKVITKLKQTEDRLLQGKTFRQ